VRHSLAELKASSFFLVGETLVLALVSSASHDGAEEKLRNWLDGIRQSRQCGFRLAVVLQLTCSMVLLRYRTALAILEDRHGVGFLKLFKISQLLL
jgi:hypothetical protein